MKKEREVKMDKTLEGWELVEDTHEFMPPAFPAAIYIEAIRFSLCRPRYEDFLADRARLKLTAGQATAEWLVENQGLIQRPEEHWESLLVFPCTIWRDTSGRLRVPCLQNINRVELFFARPFDFPPEGHVCACKGRFVRLKIDTE